MATTLIQKSQIPEIIQLYNTEGPKAANEALVTKYGYKEPSAFFRRVKSLGMYVYDKGSKKYVEADRAASKESARLGMDEPCATNPQQTSVSVSQWQKKEETLAKLANELINERFLILSRYVRLDPMERQVFIDETSLRADGYKVITYR